jgi:hypothetical protein
MVVETLVSDGSAENGIPYSSKSLIVSLKLIIIEFIKVI